MVSPKINSLQNKISNESPVGRALIGKVVGDCVDVETGRISSIRCWKSRGFHKSDTKELRTWENSRRLIRQIQI